MTAHRLYSTRVYLKSTSKQLTKEGARTLDRGAKGRSNHGCKHLYLTRQSHQTRLESSNDGVMTSQKPTIKYTTQDLPACHLVPLCLALCVWSHISHITCWLLWFCCALWTSSILCILKFVHKVYSNSCTFVLSINIEKKNIFCFCQNYIMLFYKRFGIIISGHLSHWNIHWLLRKVFFICTRPTDRHRLLRSILCVLIILIFM